MARFSAILGSLVAKALLLTDSSSYKVRPPDRVLTAYHHGGTDVAMVLWDIMHVFVAFLVVTVILFAVLLIFALVFPSARSPILSFVRCGLRGLRAAAPYMFSMFVGLMAGLYVWKLLSFSGALTGLSLGVAVFLVVFYSILALGFHRVRWFSRGVKFILCLFVMVVFTDLVVGVFVSDESLRAATAWGSSVVLSWLVMYERDSFRTYLSRAFSARRLDERGSPFALSGNDASLINHSQDDGLRGRGTVHAITRSSLDPHPIGVHYVSEAEGDRSYRMRGESSHRGANSRVGSVEIVAIPENYFAGRFQEGRQGEANLVLEKDVALRFRGFVASLVMSDKVFAFKQVFSEGRGRFLIQCRGESVAELERNLRGVEGSLHSWFPDFDTKLHLGDNVRQVGGSAACGWVSNLPAPSVNPMKHVAELFIHRRLSGCITVIAKATTSALSSQIRKGRYRRLAGVTRREEQRQPLLDLAIRAVTSAKPDYDAEKEVEFIARELERMNSRLQAKCWITLECESSRYEEAESDLDLALRTFVAAYSFEGKYEALRWGKFPRRKAEAVCRLTSELVPRGENSVLAPSDLALYFWLPEADTMARVRRKGEFLSPTGGEMASGEILLGYVLRHGNRVDEEVRLSLGDMVRHCTVIGSSGSGKTWTTINMLLDLHRQGIPFLVLDPVKKEYRCLVGAVPGLRVFTVGDETVAPLRFNILRVPNGVKPQKHVDMVHAALVASIVMYAPAPYVLQMALNEAFAKSGWDLALGKRGGDVGLLDLKKAVQEVVSKEGYEGEPRSTIIAALSTRFESLSQGGKGAALCSGVSMSPKDLVAHPTVVEFSEIGDEEDRALIILMMLLSVYEYLQTLGPTSEPRCAIVIEEAGALFSNVGGKGGVEFDSKETRRKMIEVVSRVTAEIRALGGIMVFVNQSAVSLPLEVTENTSTKIVHQVADDLNAGKVARMLGLNEEQKRALTSLEVGRPIVKTPCVSHPFQVEVMPVTQHGVDPTKFVTDEELGSYMMVAFYRAHAEYLTAQTIGTAPAKSTPLRESAFDVAEKDWRVREIVSSSKFREQYAEALSKSHREGNVKPLADLLLARAKTYTKSPDKLLVRALTIFAGASIQYNDRVRSSAYVRLSKALQSELAKRVQSSSVAPAGASQ